MIELKDGMTILFQGDSITDAGRDREDYYNLGNGYAVLAATYINTLYPEKNIKFINRGVSCECTVDMVRRWEKDCLDINPDVLIFMGGINDMWRRYDGADTITAPEEYEKNLRALMDSAKERGIKNVILMEPYLTMNESDRKIWLEEDLCFKQEIVKKYQKNTLLNLFLFRKYLMKPAKNGNRLSGHWKEFTPNGRAADLLQKKY